MKYNNNKIFNLRQRKLEKDCKTISSGGYLLLQSIFDGTFPAFILQYLMSSIFKHETKNLYANTR